MITEQICPHCGRPVKDEGTCSQCRVEQTPWLRSESRVISVRCPVCGAQKSGNTWTDTTLDRDALGPELVRAGLYLHPNLEQVSLRMAIRENTVNRSSARVTVQGLLYGIPVEGECQVEIAWLKEQCDRCNRISGNYHEGVVQVRATGRKPSLHEVETAGRIANELEEAMQSGGERLSFIVRIEETRDGMDITVGSQHIGHEIALAICRRLGGRVTTHPKLIGEKAGRQIYRVTYLVRLPRFSRGDVVQIKGRYGEVIQVDQQSIRYTDLLSGTVRSIRLEEVNRVIGNSRDARQTLVAFRDGDIIGVIEPDTGITREIPVGKRSEIGPGETVQVLKDGNTLILVD